MFMGTIAIPILSVPCAGEMCGRSVGGREIRRGRGDVWWNNATDKVVLDRYISFSLRSFVLLFLH